MSDLREDLRTYFDRVTDEVRAGTTAPVTPVATQSHRRWWIAAAAVVAVVAMVAGATLIGSLDRTDQVRTTVLASREQIRSGWERVPDAFPDNAFVNDLTSGPTGFVAVGLTFVPNGTTSDPTEPAIWHSTDGRTWSPASVMVEEGGPGEAVAVAYWRDAYYALVNISDRGTSMWESKDGQAWERFAAAPAVSGGNGTRLYADGSRVIAFGTDGLWSTSDGLSWSAGDLDGPVAGVARDGDRLVALTGRSATSGTTRIFESTDRLHWTLARDLGAEVDPGGSAIEAWHAATWVTTYPGTVDARSTLWSANGGGEWEQVDANNPPDSGFDTLAVIGPYIVATGYDADSRPGGWVSTDGRDWVSMPDLDRPVGGRLNLSASDGRAVVAASSSELRDVYLWHRSDSRATSQQTFEETTTEPTTPIQPSGGSHLVVTTFTPARSPDEPLRNDLVLVSPDNGEVVRTVREGIGLRPSVVAHGSVAYVTAFAGIDDRCDQPSVKSQITRVDLRSGDSTPVADGSNATLSRDGHKLAYIAGSCDSPPSLVIREEHGTDVVEKTWVIEDDNGRYATPVAWAPDGDQLVLRYSRPQMTFTRQPASEFRLWTPDNERPEDARAIPALGPNDGPFDLHPMGTTGRWLAVVSSGDPENPLQLVEYDITAGRVAGPPLVMLPVDGQARSPSYTVELLDTDPTGTDVLLTVIATGTVYRWSDGSEPRMLVRDRASAAWADV